MKFLREKLKQLSSIPGFHTDKKLILFISDDWGGVRVHSKKSRENLVKAGIDMDGNRFDKFDMLEANDDLESLFEVLLKYRDHKGKHPVITAVTNVANPDFDKIRESNFSQYFYETFNETLKRYPHHDSVYKLYKQGIECNIFKPELHGREHLQVSWWLEYLRNNNRHVISAFENEYWYLSGKYLNNPLRRDFAAAFDMVHIKELEAQKNIARDSAKIFKDLFGYQSIYFTPPAQHYNENLEAALAASGIRLIDVPRFRKMPLGEGKYSTKFHYLGQKNKHGQRYLTRNVVFEPNMNAEVDGVDSCLAGIEMAFRCKIPAIISNHRAAFMGGIDPDNRTKGLKALGKLFESILKSWPEAEFMSAAGLFNEMNKQ